MNTGGIGNGNGGSIASSVAAVSTTNIRVMFLGNFRPPHSTENDLLWTLRDMGFSVTARQEDEATTDEMLTWADNIDVFLYVHTHGWVTNGSFPVRELIRKFQRRGIKTVGYHLDYWYGLKRAADVGRDDFWACEYMFLPDGDKRSVEWFKSLGINMTYLPPAVVKRDCYLAEPIDSLKTDVLFVGSKHYHPEWPYRQELLIWLEMTYRDRFKHYGGDGIRSVRGAELNQLYASAKVVVGDTLCLNFDHEYYWSDRLYETRGRGGFLIHPYIVGIDNMVTTYKYRDFDGLKSTIDHYLYNEKEREQKRLLNHEYVKENHTYHNRLKIVFNTIGLL